MQSSYALGGTLNVWTRGEASLKAERFCIVPLWKDKTAWHPSSGMEWRTHWHPPVSFTAFFYQLLRCSHLGSLCGMGLSSVQGLWCFLEVLRKRWAHFQHGHLVQKGICDCKKEALDSSCALYKHLKHVCLNPTTDS